MITQGSLWHMPRTAEGKTRPPADVTTDLEGRMLEEVNGLLTSSVVKTAAQTAGSSVKACVSSNAAKPAAFCFVGMNLRLDIKDAKNGCEQWYPRSMYAMR